MLRRRPWLSARAVWWKLRHVSRQSPIARGTLPLCPRGASAAISAPGSPNRIPEAKLGCAGAAAATARPHSGAGPHLL
jgi:hypothetical protein